MTGKRFEVEADIGFEVSIKDNLAKKYPFSVACECAEDYENIIDEVMSVTVLLNQLWDQTQRFEKHNQYLEKENERLKKFMNSREHIRLSINIKTGELQRHIYATGQWFGDFNRVLCEEWISEDDYQKFVDRVIEVYNTEFKGDK